MDAAMHESFDHRRYLIPFRSLLLPQVFTDTLVIGSGVAGLRAALEAAQHGDVIVLAKDTYDIGSTAWAQGGIAAVLAEDDSASSHIHDTLNAGAGLCDDEAVRLLVDDGPERIRELIDWGMRLDRAADGSLSLGREGGHQHHRIVHSDGDATGLALMQCLAARVSAMENIRLFENCFALDLLTTGEDSHEFASGPAGEARVLGAITHHPRYGLQIIWANATILASGGAGQVYRETTNPRVVTGDGLAMAYRAGAMLADMAFIQFHPTTLYVAGSSRSLISEAVRGEGAHLVDRDGRRFMADYHEMAELAPRDVVSQAISRELARTQAQCVYLDVRHLGSAFVDRFPGIARQLRSFDIDPIHSLIPVHPSAHYTIGGVRTDLDGRTNLAGLFACGEVACTGIHGANRLASNSLLEGLVFGRRCGEIAAAAPHRANGRSIQIISDIRPSERGELDLIDVRSSLRSAMWRNVGIERTHHKLADALDMVKFWGRYVMDKIFDDPHGWETQNLLTVGALISRAALWREETRGVHLRLDHQQPSESFAVHEGWMRGSDEPIIGPLRTGAATR